MRAEKLQPDDAPLVDPQLAAFVEALAQLLANDHRRTHAAKTPPNATPSKLKPKTKAKRQR